MKLSNLIIIFVIIIIPIILIFSYYLGLEADTIRMQMDYDEKFIEATKEAVEAFEINTVEWKQGDYNTLQNVKRGKLNAATETFISSLANKLGIGGTSKEYILNYIPAIVYTMYDGYYIYSPTHVPKNYTGYNGLQIYYYDDTNKHTRFNTEQSQVINNETVVGKPVYEAEDGKGVNDKYYYYITDELGNRVEEKSMDIYYTYDISNAKKEYKHVLKTYVPYSDIYTKRGKNYVINYSLDNYIRVYGESKADSKEGYILEINEISKKEGIIVNYKGINIYPELLTENIAVRNSVLDTKVEIKEYPYIYVTSTDKRYYDIYEGENKGKFFELNSDYVKNYDIDEYKKLLIVSKDKPIEYIELYQSLNGGNEWYYKNSQGSYEEYTDEYNIQDIYNIEKYRDCSNINYYTENYCFNSWLFEKGINIDISKRKDEIIKNINNNLNLAISNYTYNSTLNYKIPELTAEDWEQALSNISMITFFQGAKIGLKTYSNYSVVTSTENNEYVSEDSLYYIAGSSVSNEDKYFHRYGCQKILENPIVAYRNIDFKVKNCNYAIYQNNGSSGIQKINDKSLYFYKHKTNMQCFDCIVNQNNYVFKDNIYEQILYNALARERYIQMSRISMLREDGIDID